MIIKISTNVNKKKKDCKMYKKKKREHYKI